MQFGRMALYAPIVVESGQRPDGGFQAALRAHRAAMNPSTGWTDSGVQATPAAGMGPIEVAENKSCYGGDVRGMTI